MREPTRRMSAEPDPEEMLDFALTWLEMIGRQNHDAYLDGMPNTCLPVGRMQARLARIRTARLEDPR